jgi:hypothetical protein
MTLLMVLRVAEPAPLTPIDSTDPSGVSLDAQRVKRFVGALVGGAVALAIPLAISAPNCGSGSCSTSFQNFSLGVSPLIAGLGAYFGHHLFGGGAEYPFAAMGAGVGALLGMLSLAFAEGIGTKPTDLFPFVAGAAGLSTFLMAIVLDLRDQTLSTLPPNGHGTAARLWATFGASVGVAILGTFTSVLLGLANPYVGLVSGLAVLAVMPLVAWAVHGALEGHGSLGSAFLGLVVSLGVLAAVAIPVEVITPSGVSTFYPSQQAALLTGSALLAILLGPIVGLELSHSESVHEAPLTPSFSFAPVAGGAMVGGGVRF